jgi:hypothetical protein
MVEYWLAPARRRIDLFGFIDLVALDGQPGVLGIQATSTGNAPARVTKILEECTDAAIDWLASGNRIEVFGWGLRGARGKRKLWTLKRYIIELQRGKLVPRAPKETECHDIPKPTLKRRTSRKKKETGNAKQTSKSAVQ